MNVPWRSHIGHWRIRTPKAPHWQTSTDGKQVEPRHRLFTRPDEILYRYVGSYSRLLIMRSRTAADVAASTSHVSNLGREFAVLDFPHSRPQRIKTKIAL